MLKIRINYSDETELENFIEANRPYIRKIRKPHKAPESEYSRIHIDADFTHKKDTK